MARGRTPFTDKDDNYLQQYIAKYNPESSGRAGNKIYQDLVDNAEGKWPWAKRHTVHSWRQRYLDNQVKFDRKIQILLSKSNHEAKTLQAEKQKQKKSNVHTSKDVQATGKGEKTAAKHQAIDKGEGSSTGHRANDDAHKSSKTTTAWASTTNAKQPSAQTESSRRVSKPDTRPAGNISTDSGYGSSSKLPPSDSKPASLRKLTVSKDQAQRPQDIASKATTRAQPQVNNPAINEVSFSIAARQGSGNVQPRPIKAQQKPKKVEVVQDSEDDSDFSLTESEADDYMHELFGSSAEEEEEEEDNDAKIDDQTSSVASSLPYERIHSDIALVAQPDDLTAAKPSPSPVLDPPRAFKLSQEPTPPTSSVAAHSSSPMQPPTPAQPPHISPVKHSPTPKKMLKRKHTDDDDPFTSTTPPATPQPPTSDARKAGKRPPLLTNNPFRNAYVPSRTQAKPDEDDSRGVWPPKRRKMNTDQVPMTAKDAIMEPAMQSSIKPTPTAPIQDIDMAQPSKPLSPARSVQGVAQPGRAAQHPPVHPPARAKPPIQPNAVASSSKVKLPASSTIQPVGGTASPLVQTFAKVNVGDSNGQTPLTERIKQVSARSSPPEHVHPAKKQRLETRAQPSTSDLAIDRLLPPPDLPPKQTERSQQIIVTTSGNDVFAANAPNGNEESRPAVAEHVALAKEVPQRIDLNDMLRNRSSKSRNRTLLKGSLSSSSLGGSASSASGTKGVVSARRISGVHQWRQSTVSTHSRISSGSRRSRLSVTTPFPDDHLDSVLLQHLATELGFALHVAEEVHGKTGSIDATKAILAQARFEASRAILTMVGDDDEESDGIPEGVIPKIPEAIEQERAKRLYIGKKPPAKTTGASPVLHLQQPSLSRPRPSLDIRPLPPEQENFAVDYSPPAGSTARKVRKLQDQGREEEAKVFLASRASSTTKGRSSSIGFRQVMGRMRMEEVDASPTPKRGDENANQMDVDVTEEWQLVDRDGAGEEERADGEEPRMEENMERMSQGVEEHREPAPQQVAKEDVDSKIVEEADDDDDDIYASRSPSSSPKRAPLPSSSGPKVLVEDSEQEDAPLPSSGNSGPKILVEDSEQEDADDEDEDEAEDDHPSEVRQLLDWVVGEVDEASEAQAWRHAEMEKLELVRRREAEVLNDMKDSKEVEGALTDATDDSLYRNR